MQCEKCGRVQSKPALNVFHKIKTPERQREIVADGIILDLTVSNLPPSRRRQTNVRAVGARAQNRSASGIPAKKEKIIEDRWRGCGLAAGRSPGDFASGIETEHITHVAIDLDFVKARRALR